MDSISETFFVASTAATATSGLQQVTVLPQRKDRDIINIKSKVVSFTG